MQRRWGNSQGLRGMENPRQPYVTGPQSGFTQVVRGSSRRRLTMLAFLWVRSTNIRLINRRISNFDCFLFRFAFEKKGEILEVTV
jgi:hypothetical protein